MAIGQGRQGRHGWGMRTGNHLETPDDAFVISHDGSRQGREGIPGDERGANIPMLQPACSGGPPRHPTHGARLCRHSLRLTRPVAAAVLALRVQCSPVTANKTAVCQGSKGSWILSSSCLGRRRTLPAAADKTGPPSGAIQGHVLRRSGAQANAWQPAAGQ
ncbi:hypothetical protein CKAH01_10089 [Colletotrichum kahawae]|uniref:Uncharacterized protein n=1 Tax=Colletotrichum kahawae TaxID=34407 RepID=A0AAD9XZN1_COLKA|nr:hypothetical protein CKAH01_10089 [Colletotrichum kahawae]